MMRLEITCSIISSWLCPRAQHGIRRQRRRQNEAQNIYSKSVVDSVDRKIRWLAWLRLIIWSFGFGCALGQATERTCHRSRVRQTQYNGECVYGENERNQIERSAQKEWKPEGFTVDRSKVCDSWHRHAQHTTQNTLYIIIIIYSELRWLRTRRHRPSPRAFQAHTHTFLMPFIINLIILCLFLVFEFFSRFRISHYDLIPFLFGHSQ